MTPQEFRSARYKADMSLQQCADYLGITSRSVRRIEAGTQAITGPIAKLIGQLANTPGKTWKGVE